MRYSVCVLRLAQLLVLGIVATRVAWHALLRHGILVRLLLLLLLLEIALVVQGGLWGHVGLGHGVVVGRHSTWLAGRDLGVVVLGRLNRVIVDAICIAAGGLWGVEACLWEG